MSASLPPSPCLGAGSGSNSLLWERGQGTGIRYPPSSCPPPGTGAPSLKRDAVTLPRAASCGRPRTAPSSRIAPAAHVCLLALAPGHGSAAPPARLAAPPRRSAGPGHGARGAGGRRRALGAAGMGYADPSSSRDLLGNRTLFFIFLCAFALVTLLQQILYGRNYLKR